MRRVLLLAYYFPPNEMIGSQRPYSWAKYFAQSGLYPTIITRNWDSNSSGVEYEKNDSFEVYRIPFAEGKQEPYNSPRIEQLRATLSFYLQERHFFDQHDAFYKQAELLLSKEKFDLILTSIGPVFLAQTTSRLAEKFGIPFGVDFRDLWNNDVLSNKRLGVLTQVCNFLIKKKITNWLKDALFVTTINSALGEHLISLFDGKKYKPEVFWVSNGFDDDSLNAGATANSKTFTMSSIGTIYPDQNIDLLINALNTFTQKYPDGKYHFNFIGVGAYKSVSDKIKAGIKSPNITLTERIPRKEAKAIMEESHILFYPAWKGYKGIASGKIYEYIASGKNILIAPSDNDVVEQIILETQAGLLTDESEKLTEIIESWYEKWLEQGKLDYHGDTNMIMKYHRKNLAHEMATKIIACLEKLDK